MATSVNSAGRANANARIAAGDVDKTSSWSFSAEDGNKLLGPNGDDWAAYGKWHLAIHSDQAADTKAHYGYPFGKNGKVYRSALTAIRQRAGQQGDTAIFDAAGAMIDKIDAKKGVVEMGTEMRRAWSTFEIKSINEDERTFEGIASTPKTDRQDDIVEPMGAQFKLPLPLMWQHGRGSISDPVGWITNAKPSSKGIPVRGQFAKPKEDYPQPLRDALNAAWVMVRDRMVRGLSIGFAPKKWEEIKDSYGLRFTEWDWLELSAVTIPANADATIQTVKSYDERQRTALGAHLSRVVRLKSTPGVTGQSSTTTTGVAQMGTKTMLQQIAEFEAKRTSLLADNAAVMEKAGEDGRTLEPDEKETYDGNAAEIKTISEHLERLRAHEKALLDNAVAVTAEVGATADAGTQTRSGANGGNGNGAGVVYGMKSRLEPGVRFTRFAMCVGAAKGNLMQAELIAANRFKDTPEVALALKTAVAAGTTQDATWAAPLVQLQEMQAEFVEFLRPQTLIGRIPNLRRVPFNIKFTRQTAGTSGTFVGEGLPKPLGKMSFELLSLLWFKAATIIVMTEELLRFSNPNAEILARNDLAAGIAQFLDKRFIDPVYAGTANVSPASITNGVTPIASLGTSIANITDTAALAIKAISDLNLNLGALVWLMSPGVAIDLGLKRTSQDIFAFPGLGASGGTFLGYPVITSNNLVLSGSPTESFVVLMDPTNVMLADDGGVSIDMSTEASLQMSDAPSDPASSTVSLWQSNMVALRAERFINWRKRHDGAVQVITMNTLW